MHPCKGMSRHAMGRVVGTTTHTRPSCGMRRSVSIRVLHCTWYGTRQVTHPVLSPATMLTLSAAQNGRQMGAMMNEDVRRPFLT